VETPLEESCREDVSPIGVIVRSGAFPVGLKVGLKVGFVVGREMM
jgi:hypothetical protein